MKTNAPASIVPLATRLSVAAIAASKRGDMRAEAALVRLGTALVEVSAATAALETADLNDGDSSLIAEAAALLAGVA